MYIRLLLSLVVNLLLLLNLNPVSAAEKEKNAARVGDAVITEGMLREALAGYVPPGVFHAAITTEQRDKYRSEALNNLVDIELYHFEALSRKITAADEVVDKVIDDNIKKFGSRDKLLAALNKGGMTEKQFRERIKKIQLVKQLLQGITRESEPSEEELSTWYENNKRKFVRPESVHLYHIIIKGDPAAPEAEWQTKQEYARAILREIREGKDFGAVAYEKSEDAYRYKSGDVGFVHRGQFEFKDIEDSAFSLKEGEISEVLRSMYGFHILKAAEKKPELTMTFDEAKETIRKELLNKKFEAKRTALLEKLKKEYPVEIFSPASEAEQ